mgnify:CR=1 FL=1
MQITLFGYEFALDDASVDASEATVREQLREYEAGERRSFDVDIDYPDTFTGDVMRAMERIPYGETRTYGDLADELDTAAVAVGQACGRNPVAVVVPCHRVVGADGGLGGYSASGGTDAKRRLLEHEGAR